MLHRNLAVGRLAVLSRHPIPVAAFASLSAHALLAAVLIWSVDEHADRAPEMLVDVDLDVAPAAPGGFDPHDPSAGATLIEEPPAPEEATPAQAAAGAAETTLEPDPESEEELRRKREKEQEEERERQRQREERRKRREEREAARKAAEEAELARNQAADAGPAQEQASGAPQEARDGGPGEAVAAGEGGGAQGPIASTPPPGTPLPSSIADGTGTTSEKPIALPPGASADLRTYAPQGDKIAVLLRYDRLRGTPWAALADAIFAPMPDYRSIVGHRKVVLADMFQSLLISSRNPSNVTATNMVARTHLSSAEVRRFLDHPQQRVTWQAARGGAVGRREASELKLDRDRRVYLVPFPGLVVLTAPKHLGALTERPVPPASGHIDARAAEADLPPWLARARSVEHEAGVESDVIAIVTVGGLRAAEVELPELGTLPTPERFSLALEMAKVGFYMRGTLAFATPELAERFETRLGEARKQLLGSTLGQLMLKNLHAYHALQGLTLRRRGTLVTYATSISNADAKAGMKLAAEWSRRFFEVPADEQEPTQAPPDGQAPATTPAPSSGPPGATPPGKPPARSRP